MRSLFLLMIFKADNFEWKKEKKKIIMNTKFLNFSQMTKRQ